MNVKDFEYIVEIARHGSISKAANRLYITQPALSRFLQRMEAELHTPLFYKVGKQFIPTPAGQCYLDYAYRILQMNSEMEESIGNIIHDTNKTIRIGASASRGEFLASLVIPLFNRRYPNYKTQLILNTKKILLTSMEKHELDLIFVNTTAKMPGYQYHHIASEDMVLLVKKNDSLVGQAITIEGYHYPFIPTENWKDRSFICPAASMNTGQFIRGYFQHRNIHPQIVSEIANIDLIFSAVDGGLGISIVPSMPHKLVFDGRLQYLSLDGEDDSIWDFSAVTRDEVALSEGTEKLIETAREVYATMG